MRISLIGAGRVAHHLAHVLNAQHQIVQIYSRSLDKAQHLAAQIGAEAIAEVEQLHSDLDLLIIAVSDQAIAQVIQEVHHDLNHVLIVHTSGSTSLAVIEHTHSRAGVFYPLQTFSFEREVNWLETPLFVEATEQQDLEALTQLANSLSNQVYQYSSKQRQTLHLAAVFACNFSNYCYDMAQQIVDAEQVDFSLLYPLILETADKATKHNPKTMQTGPAMRGDQNILQMHGQLLARADRKDLQDIYALLSEGIFKRHQING